MAIKKKVEKAAKENLNLQDTLDKIQKQHGMGAAMRLGDVPKQTYDVVSTGSLAVDEALGIGGLPFGRIVEFYGSAGGGKAQPIDTPILTPEGWKTMGDLELGDLVYDDYGNPVPVVGIFPQGIKPIFKIEMSDDTQTESCLEHLWMVQSATDRSNNRYSVYDTKRIMEDYKSPARLNYSIPFCEPIKFSQKVYPIEPYVLGLLLGDGCFRGNNVCYSSGDPELVESLGEYLKTIECKLTRKGRYDYRVSKDTVKRNGPRNNLVGIIKDLGLLNTLSNNKFIPPQFLMGSISQRLALLQGLMDTDGSQNIGRSQSEYTTVSPQLAKGVLHLIRSLGGRAVMSKRITTYTSTGGRKDGQPSYRINLFLPGLMPFRLKRKNDRLKKIDHANYFSKFISNISYSRNAEAVCIMVDSPNNTYITDDYIVTHNTTTALSVIAEAQKLGYQAAFIDLEHTFDIAYAEALGLDVENLIISQPDYAEQTFEIIEQLVRSGEVKVIVVDSTSALVPKAEIEGEFGASNMGVAAKLTSQFCRKITGLLAEHKVLLITISQLRHAIGVTWGSTERTSGGEAIKFYASIRLDIRNIAKIKEGDVIVAGRTKVFVAKNKCSVPYKSVEYTLIYGEGIDKMQEAIDMAVERAIVDKSGSWFNYKTERFHGMNAMKEWLREDETRLETLLLEIKTPKVIVEE